MTEKASLETTKLCLYVLHASSCQCPLFPLPPPQIYQKYVDGSGVTDNFLFVLGIANDFELSRDQKKLDQMLTGHPRPSSALAPLCKHGWGGEAGTCAGSCRAASTPRRTSHPTPCGIILGGPPERHGETKAGEIGFHGDAV